MKCSPVFSDNSSGIGHTAYTNQRRIYGKKKWTICIGWSHSNVFCKGRFDLLKVFPIHQFSKIQNYDGKSNTEASF